MNSGLHASAVRTDAPRENVGKLQLRLTAARVIAMVVIAVSITSLVTWLFGVDPFDSILARFERLNFNAAVAFLLLGALLHLWVPSSSHSAPTREGAARSQHTLVRALASIVALIALVNLLGYSLGTSLGLDRLLEGGDAGWSSYSGPMSILSALTVLALSGVFIVRTIREQSQLASLLALAAFGAGYVALLGYTYGAEQLYRVGATAMALEASICAVLLAVGCLLIPPYVNFMRPLTSTSAGGVLLRRLLPVALIVAPVVDLVQARAASQMGGLSMAVVGVANVLLLALLVWMTGKAVYLAQWHRRRAEESVRQTEERLQLALEAAGGGAWDLDLTRNEGWWSAEMYKLWCVEPGTRLHLEHALQIIDPRDRERVQEAIQQAIAQHTLYHCEFRIRGDGFGERWMVSRGQVHYDETGKAERLIGITLDISPQKTAEASLRRTNEALVRSNVELARFANVAAHDLQTPLRGIGSFGELLKMHYAERLDARGREWLGRILDSALHLQALVRDLLLYSVIDTKELPNTSVAMDEVLDRVLLLLGAEIRNAEAVITRTELPMVAGDAPQLVQLLLNLIGNALKYRSGQAPRIHVAAERSAEECVFSVSDNGIGIENRYAERIFEVFERLHTAQEYPGTGIGLAICRRVVQRHGGRIWVESQPGSGSTFFFTLPLTQRT